jgi:hypothetical protein
MLKPGDIAYLPFTLQTTAGVAVVFANKAALTGAGWTLTYWNAGAVVSSPTWDLVIVDSPAGRYQVALTIAAAGQGECFLTPPAGYTSSVETHTLDVESYDLDALAALFLSASGSPGVQSAEDGDLGDVVDGDSWNSGTLTISEDAMSPLGVTSLTGLTIEASFKSQPSDTAVTATATVIDAPTRQLQVSWDTFPVAMNLSGDDREKVWYLDVQLIRPAVTGFPTKRIKTPIRYQLRVVWQRETRTT